MWWYSLHAAVMTFVLTAMVQRGKETVKNKLAVCIVFAAFATSGVCYSLQRLCLYYWFLDLTPAEQKSWKGQDFCTCFAILRPHKTWRGFHGKFLLLCVPKVQHTMIYICWEYFLQIVSRGLLRWAAVKYTHFVLVYIQFFVGRA